MAQTSANVTFAVSAAKPATYNATGFGALTFTTVGGVTSVGEFGGEAELITYDLLTERVTKKLKGTINYGTIQLEMVLETADAGQLLLEAGALGSAVDTIHSFKVTLNDGKIKYFTGVVMGFRTNVGASNNVVAVTSNIELDNSVVTV